MKAISLWILLNTGTALNIRQLSWKRVSKNNPKSLDLSSCRYLTVRSPTIPRGIQRALESQSFRRDAGDPVESLEEIISQLNRYFRAMYQDNQSSHEDNTKMKIVRSLKRFLDSITQQVSDNGSIQHSLALSETLSRTLIRAIRICGDVGDYRMILSLVRAPTSNVIPITARVVGEAVNALGKTDASISKLKSLWNWASLHQGQYLADPLSTYELNIMIKTLGESRKKVEAALELYKTTDIKRDAFTTSIILNILTESIRDHQCVSDSSYPGSESPCWQYVQGLQIVRDSKDSNNFVFSAALNLNDRASKVYFQPGSRHNGAQQALVILGIMKDYNVIPDVVTCTRILSTFDKHQEWKAAVVMINSMEKADSKANGSWRLPSPNQYAYSAAISACARSGQFEKAIEILERMKHGPVKPNTWVYNAALAACVSSNPRNRNERIKMALRILNDMDLKRVDEEGDIGSIADTITYNTALAALEGMGMILRDEKGKRVCEFSTSKENEWVPCETIVFRMLSDMRSKGIPRDYLTYYNAIKASKSNSRVIFELLQEAIQDLKFNRKEDMTKPIEPGLSFIFNGALFAFANRGDIDLVIKALSIMSFQKIPINQDSVLHLLVALGKSQNSRSILTVLEAIDGKESAISCLQRKYDLKFELFVQEEVKKTEQLYAISISSCLLANDVESAAFVLKWMRESGYSPSQATLRDIAFTYTRLAIDHASKVSASKRKRTKHRVPMHTHEDNASSIGSNFALRAGKIFGELKESTPRLLSDVISAYAATELFDEARANLQIMHENALDKHRYSKLLSREGEEIMNILPRLHRSLLKICASKGNVQAAYGFVEDIQKFANKISNSSSEICLFDAPLVADYFDPYSIETNENMLRTVRNHAETPRRTGMRGEDWKLFLISASKSGDWKLCINTLQFLRPFLESCHPRRSSVTNTEKLSIKYRKLARALTAALLCFENQGQSAWAVRAVDDWIQWSGRRPPKEAILTSIRILASQGRGSEVTSLIDQVVRIQPSTSDSKESAQHTYEEILYIGAITHLHNNGLYEDADEIYLQAITHQYLPFSVAMVGNDGHHYLDLHGMNVAIANSAVRIAFQQDVLQSGSPARDLIIVTGRGTKSFYQLRPILRPEIQRMLTEEFYPPLSTFSIPGNLGALRVPSDDIQAWANHQRQQKGVKMLAVADAIKNLSSKLLRKSLNFSLSRSQWKSKE
jgi:pentatricopeptide repeat protein